MELAKGLREAMGLRLFIFFGYVLHVQNLCEWREKQIQLFDLVFFCSFALFFVLGGERHKI